MLSIGPRDLKNGTVEVARRDTLTKETIQMSVVTEHVKSLLREIQKNIFNKALRFREENTRYVDRWDQFVDTLDNEGGFIYAHWDGTTETEEKIKELTKSTIRCIPLNSKDEEGKCILTGKPSARRVLFARAY